MNILTKLKTFWSLFKTGKEVADPAFWAKTGAYGTPVLVGFIVTILSLLKGTPYEVHVTDGELTGICSVIFAIGHWIFAHITNKKVGMITTIESAEVPLPVITAPVELATDAMGNKLAVSIEQVKEAKELLERLKSVK